ncbi:MAG: YlbF family regulator [Clostridia bacterium]
MDIIELTRQLGKAIQADEAYQNYNIAKQTSELDTELQGMIGEFNLKRMMINNEAQKEERDDDKIQELNTELRAVYNQIMNNEKMIAFETAKTEMDELLQRITAIISQSADGADPETADYVPEDCSGNCSSCSGCH